MRRVFSASEAEHEPIIDFQYILNAIRRRFLAIIVTGFAVLGLAILTYFVVTPKYTATGQVGIERQDQEIVTAGQQQQGSPALTTDSSSVDTEVKQLLAPETILPVIDKLHLTSNTDFVGDDGVGKPNARLLALRTIEKKIDIERDGTSYSITVNYSYKDPVLAAAIVNDVMDSYLEHARSVKQATRERNIGLLRARLDTLRGAVSAADTDAARFRAEHNLVDVQKEATTAQQSLSVLSQSLADAQATQAAAEARNTASSAQSAGAGGSSVISPVLQQLREREADLSAQRAALAQRYGPLHPALVEVNRQLNETRDQIASEIARVRNGLSADADVARHRTSSIEASIGAQRNQLLAGNAAQGGLTERETKAETARSLYEAVLASYNQAVAQQGTETGDGYIIARAIVPQRPDSPKLIVFGAAGVLAALMASALVTLALELAETGLNTRREVERKLGLPVLASVPDLATLDRDKLKSANPMSASAHLIDHPGGIYSESFRSIRAALRLGRDNPVRSVAICSSLPNEGKTTTSFSLARSAALAGFKVVLVDCDLRRQASSRHAGHQIKAGLVEVLKKEAKLDEALTRDSASGAYLLPQRPTDTPNYDAIASADMQDLIELLKSQFDLVVLDTAPILPIADARAVASMADLSLVSVRWRKTPVQAVQMALDQLAMANATVGGVILSMVNLKAQRRSGGGDELRYYGQFSHYYA